MILSLFVTDLFLVAEIKANFYNTASLCFTIFFPLTFDLINTGHGETGRKSKLKVSHFILATLNGCKKNGTEMQECIPVCSDMMLQLVSSLYVPPEELLTGIFFGKTVAYECVFLELKTVKKIKNRSKI